MPSWERFPGTIARHRATTPCAHRNIDAITLRLAAILGVGGMVVETESLVKNCNALLTIEETQDFDSLRQDGLFGWRGFAPGVRYAGEVLTIPSMLPRSRYLAIG